MVLCEGPVWWNPGCLPAPRPRMKKTKTSQSPAPRPTRPRASWGSSTWAPTRSGCSSPNSRAIHSFHVITQQKETVRLGQGEFRKEQKLTPEAMDRAVLVCRQFVHVAHSHGAREVVAVATSACREATNRVQFLARLRRETRLDVRVISGKEEARLIYLGVASGVYLGSKRALIIDIGGGSTEVIVGGQHDYEFLDTLKLGGPAALFDFLRGQQHRPGPPRALPQDAGVRPQRRGAHASEIGVLRGRRGDRQLGHDPQPR